MATCQKFVPVGNNVVRCAREAVYLCMLPETYTRTGREAARTEYRCEIHKEGEAVRLRGA